MYSYFSKHDFHLVLVDDKTPANSRFKHLYCTGFWIK